MAVSAFPVHCPGKVDNGGGPAPFRTAEPRPYAHNSPILYPFFSFEDPPFHGTGFALTPNPTRGLTCPDFPQREGEARHDQLAHGQQTEQEAQA